MRGCTVNTSHGGRGWKRDERCLSTLGFVTLQRKAEGAWLTTRRERHLSRPIMRDSFISRLLIPRSAAVFERVLCKLARHPLPSAFLASTEPRDYLNALARSASAAPFFSSFPYCPFERRFSLFTRGRIHWLRGGVRRTLMIELKSWQSLNGCILLERGKCVGLNKEDWMDQFFSCFFYNVCECRVWSREGSAGVFRDFRCMFDYLLEDWEIFYFIS